MDKKIYNKDKPHKDIGKQKFRVRQHYTAWVEYDVVADSKDEADSIVHEHGGIDKIEWTEGYHKDEPVEVYCNDHNWDSQADSEYDKWYAGRRERITKVAECIPYEDSETIDYDDPNWEESSFEWKIEEVA